VEKKDQEYEIYDFGWWPEIVGVIGVILLIWYLIAFARGSL
jgi:hypothetical protein